MIFAGRSNVTLSLKVMETQFIGFSMSKNQIVYYEFSRLGILLLLSIIHLSLFFFNPAQKANLYFFLYAILNAITTIELGLIYTTKPTGSGTELV